MGHFQKFSVPPKGGLPTPARRGKPRQGLGQGAVGGRGTCSPGRRRDRAPSRRRRLLAQPVSQDRAKRPLYTLSTFYTAKPAPHPLRLRFSALKTQPRTSPKKTSAFSPRSPRSNQPRPNIYYLLSIIYYLLSIISHDPSCAGRVKNFIVPKKNIDTSPAHAVSCVRCNWTLSRVGMSFSAPVSASADRRHVFGKALITNVNLQKETT